MRRVRYSVAMSLDGFIADRDGGYDWIVEEPGIDFSAYLAKIDTLIMGRGTYETAQANPGGLSMFADKRIYVISTTLEPDDVPDATVISERVVESVRAMRDGEGVVEGSREGATPGGDDLPGGGGGDASPTGRSAEASGDIWLFGGGVLFRSLLEVGLVDRVEVGLVPVLLGEGVPVLPGLGHSPAGPAVAGPPSAARPAADGEGGVTSGPPVAGLRLHSAETFDSGMILLKYDVGRV